MMLKAYIDDSNMGIGLGPVAVLAGWLAPARTWATFVGDWQQVLDMKPKIDFFKWSDYRSGLGPFHGISGPMADEKLNLLINVLEEHKPLGVASVMSNDLHNQIFGGNGDRIMRGPYFLSFFSIVVQMVEYAAEHHPGERIDFIFDIQPGQMEAAVASWERLKEVAPQEMKAIIGNVSFNDDKDVLSLQAADLNAGWTREQADAFLKGQEIPEPPWGNRGSSIISLTRTWTAEVYEDLAKRTGAFQMPEKIIDPASRA